VTPLDDFLAATGIELPALIDARARTAERMQIRRELLQDRPADDDVTVVLMGSWGRSELTSESDDDYMVLVHGEPREAAQPSIADVEARFAKDPAGFKAPGPTNIFGELVFSSDLVGNIGLDADTNKNLTRRMLLVLESAPLTAPDIHTSSVRAVVEGYLDDSIKDLRPPRFLLNDIVRYWRTIGVDFVAKDRARGGEGWGLRNIKLRTSRKLLFAGGLLPVLRCHEYKTEEMLGFLLAQFATPPIDRVADTFLHYRQLEHGVAALKAYDQFLAGLEDAEVRADLKAIGDPAAAESSRHFATMSDIGMRLDYGLLGLLFSPALASWTKRYGIL
jgi:Putative nucleotidyltransferase DUF294